VCAFLFALVYVVFPHPGLNVRPQHF